MNLLITESHKGVDPLTKELLDNAVGISFTCRPSYNTTMVHIKGLFDFHPKVSMKKALKVDGMNDPISFLEDNCGDNIVFMIKDLHAGEGDIFLAQDYDANGELMSSMLYYHLIDAGVEQERIHRVPILDLNKTEGELNFAIGEFYPMKQMLRIIEFDRLEQLMMQSAKKTVYGYRNMAALAHTLSKSKNPNAQTEVLSDGIAMPTYYTKYALNERG